ncbi:MAG TPA: hypothetical protein VF062_18680 [Candidatus Limnocylindrales bacterium]
MLRGTPPRPAGDVYSLCATLLTLLTDRPHEHGMAKLPIAVLHTQEALLAVLFRGMSADPRDRPSAAELGRRLADIATGSPVTNLFGPEPPTSYLAVSGGSANFGTSMVYNSFDRRAADGIANVTDLLGPPPQSTGPQPSTPNPTEPVGGRR